jgi:hypothetical protein
MTTVAVPSSHDTDRYCGARTRSGGSCRRPSGWGTDHVGAGRCKLHGGSSPSGRKAARRKQAERAVVTYGLPRDVPPEQALLEELHRTAGHVAWLGELVAGLDEEGLKQYTKDKGLLWEKPSVWLELYQAERKHLASVAADCVRIGIEERHLRLAESTAGQLAAVLKATVAGLLELALSAVEGEAARGRLRAAWDARAAGLVRQQILTVTAGEQVET